MQFRDLLAADSIIETAPWAAFRRQSGGTTIDTNQRRQTFECVGLVRCRNFHNFGVNNPPRLYTADESSCVIQQ
jgi:hypothetical protein